MAKNDFQIFNMAWGILTLCDVARSRHWFRQVTAPCNVACGSGIVTMNIHQVAPPYNVIRGSGMTCHWIRPNVRHIGILHLVSISTTSQQSLCHSAPVSEVLSKSDHLRQKKMTSCRFSRRRISAILDFRDPIMYALKTQLQLTKLLSFQKIAFLHFGDRQTDRQTDKQMDIIDAWSRSLAIASCGLIIRSWWMQMSIYIAHRRKISASNALIGKTAQAPPHCTKCNSPRINGQCTNHRIAI